MTDIAPIKGLIELTDNFTSQIGLAEAALSNFTKENQESLIAVAGAAGIVAAAIGAIAVATIELGKRGADVNDVNSTLEHFAGGANAAKDAMDALRAGTKGTVTDFILAKDAAHLLSAGVQLTAQDFGTLGQAAFVLQNRGLGGTKEQLDLVSDALVTGRTRALAMSLGVVAVDDAQEKYARTLGVSVDQLSNAGKAEANRLEVMRILNSAVKEAGVQERDFGEEIEFARTTLVNWIDDLGSAVASSKVFAAGFKAIETAVEGAFDGDKQKAIDTVVHLIESGAIKALDFAQGAIVMARIVEGAWEGVRTVVLGVETALVFLLEGVVKGIAAVSEAGSALHIISPETTAGIENARVVLHGMTVDLAAQTMEAAKAVVGHTAFDETLDDLSSSLSDVRNAMSAAQAATENETKTQVTATDATKKHAASQADLNAKMIDQGKIAAAMTKSTTELAAIWDSYFKIVAKNSGTAGQAAREDIEQTFNTQVASLDALDPLFAEKYKAMRAVADAQLKGISADWDSVKDKAKESLQETADKALATYEQMKSSGLTFTREALSEQLQKWRDLRDQVLMWGQGVQTATATAVSGIKVLDTSWVTDADIAANSLNNQIVMVRLLNGELVKLEEAKKRQEQGNSITYDLTTKEGLDYYKKLNPAAQFSLGDDEIMAFAQKGGTLQQLLQQGLLNPYGGRGFAGRAAEGGIVQLGEHGPELVELPVGAAVYPTGSAPASAGGRSVTTVNVNMTGMLVDSSPAAKSMLRQLVIDAVTSATAGQRFIIP